MRNPFIAYAAPILIVTHHSSLPFRPAGRVPFFARPKMPVEAGTRVSGGSPFLRRWPCGGRRVNSRFAFGQHAPLFRRLGCAAQPLPMGNCRPNGRHCEERSDEAIQKSSQRHDWIASPAARNDVALFRHSARSEAKTRNPHAAWILRLRLAAPRRMTACPPMLGFAFRTPQPCHSSLRRSFVARQRLAGENTDGTLAP